MCEPCDGEAGAWHVGFGDTVVPNITPIMENQMEQKTENEMETGIIWGLYCIICMHVKVIKLLICRLMPTSKLHENSFAAPPLYRPVAPPHAVHSNKVCEWEFTTRLEFQA